MRWSLAPGERRAQLMSHNDAPSDKDQDSDDTPETPLDEPRPPRVEDPPPQPEQQGPYVVSGSVMEAQQ